MIPLLLTHKPWGCWEGPQLLCFCLWAIVESLRDAFQDVARLLGMNRKSKGRPRKPHIDRDIWMERSDFEEVVNTWLMVHDSPTFGMAFSPLLLHSLVWKHAKPCNMNFPHRFWKVFLTLGLETKTCRTQERLSLQALRHAESSQLPTLTRQKSKRSMIGLWRVWVREATCGRRKHRDLHSSGDWWGGQRACSGDSGQARCPKVSAASCQVGNWNCRCINASNGPCRRQGRKGLVDALALSCEQAAVGWDAMLHRFVSLVFLSGEHLRSRRCPHGATSGQGCNVWDGTWWDQATARPKSAKRNRRDHWDHQE